MTYRIMRDRSHMPIATALIKSGYSVVDLSGIRSTGVPDLLVSDKDVTVLMEIKNPGGTISVGQLEFMSHYKGHCGFVTDYDGAKWMMSLPYSTCLSRDEKEKMGIIAYGIRARSKAKNPQISIAKLEKEMAK